MSSIVRAVARMQVVTSGLSLARELWRYGEPDLARRALVLPAEAVLEIGARVEPLLASGAAERLWPNGPKDRAILLAAVEYLEGTARPCARRTRLPEGGLPDDLQATEEQRYTAAAEVARVMDRRNAGR
jgi:hypothetical protein